MVSKLPVVLLPTESPPAGLTTASLAPKPCPALGLSVAAIQSYSRLPLRKAASALGAINASATAVHINKRFIIFNPPKPALGNEPRLSTKQRACPSIKERH